jgi:hypothetical protein
VTGIQGWEPLYQSNEQTIGMYDGDINDLREEFPSILPSQQRDTQVAYLEKVSHSLKEEIDTNTLAAVQ